MRREQPTPGADWERSHPRVRFLLQLFGWILGTLLYVPLMFLALLAAPAGYRDQFAIGLVLLYFLAAAVFILIVLHQWRRSRSR